MTNLAQVQTNTPMHFNKPFILVTRYGNNDTNNPFYNPVQLYYEHDSMKELFKHAATFRGEEVPVSALRHVVDAEYDTDSDGTEYRIPMTCHYFHNFTTALDEYKRGIRVDM